MIGVYDVLNIKPGFDKDVTPLASRNPTFQRQCYLVLPGLSCCECHHSVSSLWGSQQMRGRRAGKNKRLNVQVGHKINQTRNVWEV